MAGQLPGQTLCGGIGHNFSRSFACQMRRWAHHRRLPLISIGYRNDWADEQWIAAAPHDFAHLIARAEAVATNFFHGCIFALGHSKPFVCEATPYRSHKIQGLMGKIGGEKHLLTEDSPAAIYSTQLSKPLNPVMLQQIDRLRQCSNAYLSRALA